MGERKIDFCWRPSKHATSDHLVYDELVVGSVQSFESRPGLAYAWSLGERMGSFEPISKAREAVIQAVSRELLLTAPPDPSLVGTFPIVMYLGSARDRDEFEAIIRSVKPNLTTRKV